MVDVDNLSDAELRTKLMEYGFPVMPITGTTRKVMVKKLKLLMENKNKINNEGRRSLTRYSSDDDSEAEMKSNKKDKNRRLTAPPSALGSSFNRSSLRRGIHQNDNDEVEVRPEIKTSKVSTMSTTKTTVTSVGDDFDTGSDSEPEILENNKNKSNEESKKKNHRTETDDSPPKSTLSSSSYGFLNKSNYTSTSKTENQPSYGFTSSYTSRLSSPSRYSSYSSSASPSNEALDRLNQIRSRLSLNNSTYEKPTSYTSPSLNNEESNETPFLSNFTKRLSQISAGSPRASSYGFRDDIIKENDMNYPGSYTRSSVTRLGRQRDIGSRYQRQDSNMVNIVRNNMVSFAVVGIAFLFFILIGVMYLGMRGENSALETAGYVIPYCIPNDQNSIRGENCIADSEVMSAITLMKNIKPELVKHALNHRCKDSSVKPYMTEDDIVNYIFDMNGSRDLHSIELDINNLELLIFKNPDWGISVVEAVGRTISDADAFENMKQIITNRATTTIGLAVLNPDLPWQCIISNKVFAIVNTILIFSGSFIILYLTNLSYKYYRQYQQQKKDELFDMVGHIIDVLQSNAGDDITDNNFLVINHVRDMIIPISDRKRKEKLWQKAVKFINENESRIRTEIQVVQGEPYEVWRWVGSHNVSATESPRNKIWQGQAFETQVGSVNSLPCSPTPCLKIRGMVDDAERNLSAIREAILAKCAHQCRILHCAVDNSTKCVYLKCASQNDAAIAYRNLHGWWYAGHLVTVKYVRLERYMQRFPDSPTVGPPFLKAVSNPSTDWSN